MIRLVRRLLIVLVCLVLTRSAPLSPLGRVSVSVAYAVYIPAYYTSTTEATAKRGMGEAFQYAQHTCEDASALNIGWLYDWGSEPKLCYPSIESVPMALEISPCKFTKEFFGDLVVSVGGVFNSIKQSDMPAFAMSLNLGNPPSVLLAPVDALISRDIVLMSDRVLHIFRIGANAEIGLPAIQTVPIDVVYVLTFLGSHNETV